MQDFIVTIEHIETGKYRDVRLQAKDYKEALQSEHRIPLCNGKLWFIIEARTLEEFEEH